MKTRLLACILILIGVTPIFGTNPFTKDAAKGINQDPTQKNVGDKPYEMEGRKEAREPFLTFDDCTQWQVRTWNSEANLYRTQEQRVINDYSGKVLYKTHDRKAGFRVELVEPIKLNKEWDCINFWNYGNHWLWENAGEAMTHHLVIEDAKGQEVTIPFMQEWLWRNMNYKYWFLNHIKLNDSIQRPVTLIGLEFTGEGTVPEQVNQIYLGPLYAYKEELKPMEFEPLPEKMPFPLRSQTILPTNKLKSYTNRVTKEQDRYLFTYQANDATLVYELDPSAPIGGLTLLHNGKRKELNTDAEIIFENGEQVKWSIVNQRLAGDTLFVRYKASASKFKANFDCFYTICQKSFVWNIEELSEKGRVEEIRLGTVSDVTDGKLISIPFLVYNPFANDSYTADRPDLLYTDDLFYFNMFDWYYTNASMYYADRKSIEAGKAAFNGGVRYYPMNNKVRNPLRERLFYTVSPDVHEVFPTIDNPKSPMRSNQADRLWAINGGSDLEKLGGFVSRMRSKGLEKVSIRYHEEFWREGGESYTFRLEPNPQLGREGIQKYVRFVQDHDWRIGLYSNYMDYAPVNALWNEDWVRISRKDGGWGPAWCRCYAPKPYIGWRQQAILAPQIHKIYQPNFSYCDVETCISPMDRVDYDSRVPGAGKFRAVIEYVGLTLLNERRAYQAPVFSEGGTHWFYAGLCDGNYAHMDKGLPVFPDFQLLKIHPLEMDAASNVSGDEYLAYALAFGNIGILSEGADAVKRYAFLQPLQSSYAMIPVVDIAYHNGSEFVSSSEAIKQGLLEAVRLRLTYESGLIVYVNFADESWQVSDRGEAYTLPKHGVLSFMPGESLKAYSVENADSESKTRLDRVFSNELYYLDTHGELTTGELAGKGAYMLKKEKFGWEIIPVDSTEVIDFDLSLLNFDGFGIDIQGVDEHGNAMDVINETPVTGRVHFTHDSGYYKYRLCPVTSVR